MKYTKLLKNMNHSGNNNSSKFFKKQQKLIIKSKNTPIPKYMKLDKIVYPESFNNRVLFLFVPPIHDYVLY